MRGEMHTSTFAHPYTFQVIALWLSFLPIAGIGALLGAATLRGDRPRGGGRIVVPVPVPPSV